MEPFTEILLNREAVNASPAATGETMNILADILLEVGWPERWQIVRTAPDRAAVPISREVMEAAADKVHPEWLAEGAFAFVSVGSRTEADA